MINDRDRPLPGKLSETLLEWLAAVVILVGCGGTALVFIGLLYRAIVWAWS